jgi:hypothetical protein
VSQLLGQTNHESENINQKPSVTKDSSVMCCSAFAVNKMQRIVIVHTTPSLCTPHRHCAQRTATVHSAPPVCTAHRHCAQSDSTALGLGANSGQVSGADRSIVKEHAEWDRLVRSDLYGRQRQFLACYGNRGSLTHLQKTAACPFPHLTS